MMTNKDLHAILFCVCIIIACSEYESDCDEFTDVHRLMEDTANGIPRGYYALNVQGSILRNYDPNLILALNNFLYWRDLYWYYCKKDDYYYRDDYYSYRHYGYLDVYYENARYYASILAGYYRRAFHLYLDFDGISNFRITTEPVDPDSTITPFTMLSITDLGVGDIGVDITLDPSMPTRIFHVEYHDDLFTSLETGSSLKLRIHNIRPAGESTLIDVLESSVLFNDAGNMESVSIEGSMNPWRR